MLSKLSKISYTQDNKQLDLFRDRITIEAEKLSKRSLPKDSLSSTRESVIRMLRQAVHSINIIQPIEYIKVDFKLEDMEK